MGPGAVPHPHRDGEGLLQAGAHHAVGDLDGLGAVELEHLVAVVAVVRGQPDGPVGGAAGGRQQLHGAGARSYEGKHRLSDQGVFPGEERWSYS